MRKLVHQSRRRSFPMGHGCAQNHIVPMLPSQSGAQTEKIDAATMREGMLVAHVMVHMCTRKNGSIPNRNRMAQQTWKKRILRMKILLRMISSMVRTCWKNTVKIFKKYRKEIAKTARPLNSVSKQNPLLRVKIVVNGKNINATRTQ